MEAKKKYEKSALWFVADLKSILECLYEAYGTEGELLLKGEQLPGTSMIEKRCSELDAEQLHQMFWKIYMVSSRKEEFVVAAKKELQPYLEEES